MFTEADLHIGPAQTSGAETCVSVAHKHAEPEQTSAGGFVLALQDYDTAQNRRTPSA